MTFLPWLLIALPGWLCVTALLVGMRHAGLLARLWREPALRFPVVIVESDDWGPGPASDAEALREIADVLRSVRDSHGRAPVMTIGLVLAIPDGPRIVAGGHATYHPITLADARHAAIVDTLRRGIEAGVFSVQRHGFEHLWPASLLACAQTDPALQAWLVSPIARSEDLPPALQSRWTDVTVLPSAPLPSAAVDQAVAAERELLCVLFGAAARVAVPNTFVWDPIVELAWRRHGVEVVVTPGTRYAGRDREGRLIGSGERILGGERSAQGLRYLVRDAYFEPSRGHRAEDVLRDFAAHNATARPLLLETHRENFVRGDETRRGALRALREALEAVLRVRPDTRFMSTVELADALGTPDGPLLAHEMCSLLTAWLHRVRNEAALRRPLKWSGLDLLIRGLLAMLPVANVPKSGRTPARFA